MQSNLLSYLMKGGDSTSPSRSAALISHPHHNPSSPSSSTNSSSSSPIKQPDLPRGTRVQTGKFQNAWESEQSEKSSKEQNPQIKKYPSTNGKYKPKNYSNKSDNKKFLPPKPPEKRKTLEDLEFEQIDNEPIGLSPKQYAVIEAILNKQSVFFTGAAGTGKSYILHLLRELSTELGISEKVVFTAPTGLAACNIGGLTIHSWAGIGLGTGSTKQLVDQILGRHEVRNRWRATEILVIDEISMLSAELFDTLSEIGKRVRNNYTQPFGGIQLVVCGDFFQLPPVQLGPKNRFCFKSQAWQELFPDDDSSPTGKIITLDRVYRQRENQFLDILHEIRLGEVSETTKRFLCNKVMTDLRRRKLIEHQGRLGSTATSTETSDLIVNVNDPPDLGPHQQDNEVHEDDVDIVYDRPTKLFGYNRQVDDYNKSELAKLPNESFYFQSEDFFISKTFENQLKNGCRLPEKLELKIGAEVILLWNVDHSTGLVNGARGRIIDFEKSRGRSKIFRDVLPVIEFHLKFGDREVTDTRVIIEQESEIKQGNHLVASRTQLPLMLAYAMSIHKAQGMTIPKLEVSFNGVFEFGQGYVAISRATDLEGLFLTSFNPSLVKAHPDVKQYYAHLFLSNNTDSSVAERMTSLRELCKINKNALEMALEKGPPVREEKEGWIVKKGGQALSDSDDENTTTAPSISPDECDHGPDPFSTSSYDDFLEYEFPKKKRQLYPKPLRQQIQPTISAEEEPVPLKKSRVIDPPEILNNTPDVPDVFADHVGSENSTPILPPRMSDYLPSTSKNSSDPVYQTEWSGQAGHAGRTLPANAPIHSHLRCVDPNKTWNMIARTTGPTTNLQSNSQHHHRVPSTLSNPPPIPPPILPPTAQADSQITDELKRKIEANKLRAMARLQENRAKRTQETDNIINSLS